MLNTFKKENKQLNKIPISVAKSGNMQSFKLFLHTQGLRESTIQGYIQHVERLIQWSLQNNYSEIEQHTYTELLGYVQSLKEQSLKVSSINKHINSIRHYYEHLKQERKIENNPAKRIFIKGAIRTIIEQPLSYTELETLYMQYEEYLAHKPVREAKHKQLHSRNKVIVSLMIWQGAHSGTLNKMEVSHIKLHSGTVYLPSTGRSHSRELKLEPIQIIPLHDYINTLPATQEKLFTTEMHDTVMRLVGELKGINPIIRNALHIRASVLLHWLKMYDKRTVQYMAGHRWISSTEKYETQELTGLTDLLSKHHPFS